MFVIIDIETTGLHPETDRITEIALLQFDGREITQSTSFLINPECRIPAMVSDLTGLTNAHVDSCPRFAHFAKQIVEETEGRVLVAHNVRFDYGFLAAEFRRLGYAFRRPQLCTVRLGRQYFSGLPSYSLGNICRALEIPMTGQHRALADATATAELLKKLIEQSGLSPEAFARASKSDVRVPPQLKMADIEAIPDETGVYYFYDALGTILYVGKSLHLRERILSHFSADIRNAKERRLKELVARIDFKVTGSELVALLYESAEIKRLKPLYNRAQRREKDLIGLFLRKDAATGYTRLSLQSLAGVDLSAEAALKTFPSFTHGRRALDAFIDEHELCSHLVQYRPSAGRPRGACFRSHVERCRGACTGKESADNYNSRVELALHPRGHEARPNSYLLSERGREAGEKALVWVQNGIYRGYGYWNSREQGPLKASNAQRFLDRGEIQLHKDNADIRRILAQYLNALNKKIKLFPLSDLRLWPLDIAASNP